MHINCGLNASLVLIRLSLDLLLQLLVGEAGTLAQFSVQAHAFWPLQSLDHLAIFVLIQARSEAFASGMRVVIKHCHQVVHVEQVLRDGAVVRQLAQPQDGVPDAAVRHQSRHDRLLRNAQLLVLFCVFEQPSADSIVHLPQRLLKELLLGKIIG